MASSETAQEYWFINLGGWTDDLDAVSFIIAKWSQSRLGRHLLDPVSDANWKELAF